ncbi:sugar ABC transporter ATP-binding protein [Brevundimonas sp. Root1279]|uniref:sugar ABC transporter ATP-binding protein n=1 Tax=Brevundimonas sp. Root1279 TaxID=1736443 RepID=UPI0006F64BD1|nr:sugar ABC transporter ATP-binding protein [Brevundimonas sp. Root1279]KQW82386.1 D-ribose transporter ATP-binding protein [Brevundimonas sp. Root1279]
MTPPLLKVHGLTKRFPGVLALDDVRLEVAAGEVHALLGENGAGKSTLLRAIAAALKPDAGEILLAGERLDPRDAPADRQARGVVTIYQEFNLVPALTVAENLYLGREPRRGGFIDWRRLNADAAAVLQRLGVDLAPTALVGGLSVALQQMVEIARALTLDARLIIMDEPTAALSGREVEVLHRTVLALKASGVGVIYVTHRLAEVKAICDRYTVFRDGRYIQTGAVADVKVADLVAAMVGRDIAPAKRAPRAPGDWALRVSGVSRSRRRGAGLHDLALGVRAGEVLGLAGLVGAGRTELARAVFGADGPVEGVLWMGGDRPGLFRSPAEAMAAGLTLAPEDRKADGCFMPHSVRWNLSLPSLDRFRGFGGFIDDRGEAAMVDDFMKRLRIRAPSDATPIGALSGGNQQKVLLARCMALRPKVLIVDEPTRGVDVGAKAEVHQILFDLADAGVGVIVISSDMPELLEVSDRIVVLHEGRLGGEVARSDATEARLMQMMTGQSSTPVPAVH